MVFANPRLYLIKKSNKILENFVLKINTSKAKMLTIPAKIGQTEAKTTFPTVALISTENFIQVAGKNMNAVAMAVKNNSK